RREAAVGEAPDLVPPRWQIGRERGGHAKAERSGHAGSDGPPALNSSAPGWSDPPGPGCDPTGHPTLDRHLVSDSLPFVATYGSTDGAWNALGDPTRRAILERLAERPCAVGELAAELPVS